MGILDMLPWKKKDDDFLRDVGSAQQDPFAQQNQQSSPQDPLAPMQDPLAGRDPLTNQGVLDDGAQSSSRFNDMQDPFAELPSSSAQVPQSFNSKPSFSQHSSGVQEQYNQQFIPQEHHTYAESPSRDVELILAKLDAIKSELDSVHQRVRKLEQVSDASHPQKYKW